MKRFLLRAAAAIVSLAAAGTAWGCGCAPLDKYLNGQYHGDCDEETELSQGKGTARGADTYTGHFVQGKPDGTGVYQWENGARLEGSFKGGKAHGIGLFVSASGARYHGPFVAGLLRMAKAADCPQTPGPLNCEAGSK
jgi:hypothetical protein